MTTRPVEVAAQGLRLRRFTLQVLREEGPSPEVPQVGPSAWDVFLRSERCATTLLEHIRHRNITLPTSAAEKVERAAMLERAKVVRASAQLGQIAQLAGRMEAKVIVLKGSLPILEAGPILDLDDIDVLVMGEDVSRFADALDQDGYRQEGSSSARHLTTRRASQALDVEIHVAIDIRGAPVPPSVWAKAEQVVHAGGLWCLHPADHLWHVLVHSVADHPNRRSRIRDVLLLRHALSRCDAAALDDVAKRTAGHPVGKQMEAMIGLARDLEAGATDPFESVAFTRYYLQAGSKWRWLQRTGAIYAWVTALQLGPFERRVLLHQPWLRSRAPSLISSVRWLERVAPRLGRIARVSVRLGYQLVMATLALPLAAKLAWQARRAERG